MLYSRTRPSVDRNPGPAARRRPWRVVGVALVALVAIGGQYLNPVEPPGAPEAVVEVGGGAALPRVPDVEDPPAPVGREPPGPPAPAPAEARRLALAKRLALAEELLCSFHDASKYPFTSRPIYEHPDQIYPNRPIAQRRAMRTLDGRPDAHIQIHTTQSRVFMAAGEPVVVSIAAMNDSGERLPLAVERATARGLPARPDRPAPQFALPMADDGRNGDTVASDRTVSGAWTPAETDFADFAGTIRIEIEYTVEGRACVAWLDVVYSPEVPATWSAPIRDAIDGGSLVFLLKAKVQTPGRYLASGRVVDARDRPIALLMFNDLLGAGEQEIRLSLHGKLIRDLEPAFPLKLRDVDAYLLKDDADPDRALMPRLEGDAHTTRVYALSKFSPDEWQSEQRSRYLTEFIRDVEQTRAELAEQDPTQPGVSFTPDQCRGFNANISSPQA